MPAIFPFCIVLVYLLRVGTEHIAVLDVFPDAHIDEPVKSRTRGDRPARKLRMELHAEKERVTTQLGNLHNRLSRRPAGKQHAGILKNIPILWIELIPMPETFMCNISIVHR